MKSMKPLLTLLILLQFFAGLGCSKRVSVPGDAKLIWQGIPDTPNDWRDVTKENEGTLYLVDAKSGNVKEVRTIWKEKPTFTFNIEIGKEYQLYLKSEPVEQKIQNQSH
jgi:selenophosphate synthetase-related protein